MSTSTSSPRRRKNPIRLGDAFRAVRKLIANPDGTDQVFVIISALSGNSGERQFQRFSSTSVGRRILSEESGLLSVLMDRETLHALPEGTLGHAYLGFVEREQLSADGLVDASQLNAVTGLCVSECQQTGFAKSIPAIACRDMP